MAKVKPMTHQDIITAFESCRPTTQAVLQPGGTMDQFLRMAQLPDDRLKGFCLAYARQLRTRWGIAND